MRVGPAQRVRTRFVRCSYELAGPHRGLGSYTVRTVFVRACRTPPSARFVHGSYDVPTSLQAPTEALVRTRFMRGSNRDAGRAARVVRTRFVRRCGWGPRSSFVHGSYGVRTSLQDPTERSVRARFVREFAPRANRHAPARRPPRADRHAPARRPPRAPTVPRATATAPTVARTNRPARRPSRAPTAARQPPRRQLPRATTDARGDGCAHRPPHAPTSRARPTTARRPQRALTAAAPAGGPGGQPAVRDRSRYVFRGRTARRSLSSSFDARPAASSWRARV